MRGTQEIINCVAREIKSHFSDDEIVCAAVFGSWARDEHRYDSDIDLIVVFKGRTIPSAKIEKFKTAFIGIQKSYGLAYDGKYPLSQPRNFSNSV